MRKLFITIIIIFFVFQAFSQVESTERQILNYDDSKSVIISKGRSLLLDKFLENDVDKVKEIKNYLLEKGEDESFQDTLNIQADNFLKAYPEAEYKDFTPKHIKFQLVPKNWGMAFEFFSGYGIFTGTFCEKGYSFRPKSSYGFLRVRDG